MFDLDFDVSFPEYRIEVQIWFEQRFHLRALSWCSIRVHGQDLLAFGILNICHKYDPILIGIGQILGHESDRFLENWPNRLFYIFGGCQANFWKTHPTPRIQDFYRIQEKSSNPVTKVGWVFQKSVWLMTWKLKFRKTDDFSRKWSESLTTQQLKLIWMSLQGFISEFTVTKGHGGSPTYDSWMDIEWTPYLCSQNICSWDVPNLFWQQARLLISLLQNPSIVLQDFLHFGFLLSWSRSYLRSWRHLVTCDQLQMVGNVDRCGLHSASVLEHMGNHQWPLLFSKKLSHEIRPIIYSLYRLCI